MYRERRRFLGELAAWHVSWVGALMPMVGAKLNPADINPYRDATTRASKKIEEVRAFINAQGIAALAGRAEPTWDELRAEREGAGGRDAPGSERGE